MSCSSYLISGCSIVPNTKLSPSCEDEEIIQIPYVRPSVRLFCPAQSCPALPCLPFLFSSLLPRSVLSRVRGSDVWLLSIFRPDVKHTHSANNSVTSPLLVGKHIALISIAYNSQIFSPMTLRIKSTEAHHPQTITMVGCFTVSVTCTSELLLAQI